ncbi:hypothetical protein RU639_007801 [Aspergillus parasiticus]
MSSWCSFLIHRGFAAAATKQRLMTRFGSSEAAHPRSFARSGDGNWTLWGYLGLSRWSKCFYVSCASLFYGLTRSGLGLGKES